MHMISVEPTLEGPPSLSGQYSKMHLAACRQTAENRASRPVLPLQPADARACIAEGLRVETKLKDSVDGRHCCCHCSRGKTLSQPPELTETVEPIATGLAGGDAGDLASVENAAHLLQLSHAKIWVRTALTLTTEMHMPMAPATGLSQTQLTILHSIPFD